MKYNLSNRKLETLETGEYLYRDIVKAIGYWVVLNDLTAFFKQANMPKVYYHLSETCKEIDHLYKEYENSNLNNCTAKES